MSGVDQWNSQLALHRGYLHDRVRNDAFQAAILEHVKPGMRVVDLGSGSGIWACVAARAGASKVVAIEFSDLAFEARRTVERNQLTGIVEVIQDDIRNIKLARDFDVVIHELIGGLLWEEDMIELCAHAHDTFLHPGGVMMPGVVHMSMCPWLVPNDRPRRVDWTTVCGIDVSHMYDAEAELWRPKAVCLHNLPVNNGLAAPRRVYTARVGRDREPIPNEVRFDFVAQRDGIASGIVAFMDIELSARVSITTAPTAPGTSWGQLYIPAVEPLAVDAGASYAVRVVPKMTQHGWEIEWGAIHPPSHFLH